MNWMTSGKSRMGHGGVKSSRASSKRKQTEMRFSAHTRLRPELPKPESAPSLRSHSGSCDILYLSSTAQSSAHALNAIPRGRPVGPDHQRTLLDSVTALDEETRENELTFFNDGLECTSSGVASARRAASFRDVEADHSTYSAHAEPIQLMHSPEVVVAESVCEAPRRTQGDFLREWRLFEPEEEDGSVLFDRASRAHSLRDEEASEEGGNQAPALAHVGDSGGGDDDGLGCIDASEFM